MLDIMEKVDEKLLVEYGLELIRKYGFLMNEEEKQYFKENIDKIETDFLGFGNYYAMALKHMEENIEGKKTIVDIGCAWGLFSYMFRDYNYIGLDESTTTFFKYHDNFRYILGSFPDVVPEADGFMAVMSLGFNRRFSLNESNESFIQKLREAFQKYSFGFTHTAEWVEKVLELDFDRTTIVDGDDVFYYWRRKN